MGTEKIVASARRVVVACLTVALAACSTLPPYTRPSVAVPAHYAGAPVGARDGATVRAGTWAGTGTGAEAGVAASVGTRADAGSGTATAPGWAAAAPADARPRGDWWTSFGDADLNQLEARVDVSNQTVKKAVSQLRDARAMVDQQRASYFPTLGASLSQNRSLTSQNLTGRALAGRTVSDYAGGLTASWEPDLFGKIANGVAGARASAQASAADLEAVRLAVSADLAVDYFDLRSVDQQKQLLDDSVRAYGAALNMVQQRFRNGAADPLALAQAQTQLEATRTQATDTAVLRAQLQHAIATLVGEPASTFTIAVKRQAFTLPAIPAGLPSQLLERRPDIAAAERRVAAANAQIGLARSAFFPDLVLSAGAGLESSLLAPWLAAPSLFWSVGPQLVGTLFDGGRRKAQLAGANAQYDGYVSDYRQTVLLSLQQVEDNLSALRTLATEAQSQQRATDAAHRALAAALNRYRAGAVGYLDVVTMQTVALTNDRASADIARRRADASVGLLKSLGGGWDGKLAGALATRPGTAG